MTEDLDDQAYKPCKNCDGTGKFIREIEVLYSHIPECKRCNYAFLSPDSDQQFKWSPAYPWKILQMTHIILADYFKLYIKEYWNENDQKASYEEYCDRHYNEAEDLLNIEECEKCKGAGKIDWVTDIMKP